jgi:hypothetical protein
MVGLTDSDASLRAGPAGPAGQQRHSKAEEGLHLWAQLQPEACSELQPASRQHQHCLQRYPVASVAVFNRTGANAARTHLTHFTPRPCPHSPVLHMSTHITAEAWAPSASIKDKLLQLLKLVANTGEAGGQHR